MRLALVFSIVTLAAAGCRAPSTPAPSDVPLPSARAKAFPPLPKNDVPEDPAVHYLPGHAFHAIGGQRSAAVVGNVRVTLDGRGAHAVDTARVADLGRFATLPETLGGGVLFVGDRTVRFAPKFDGALVEVAQVPDVEVGIGYRSVFVRSRTAKTAPRLFDLPSGKEIPMPVPALVSLYGTPSGLVGAFDEKGALFVARGKNKWRRVAGPPVTLLRYDGVGLVVTTDKGDYEVELDDKLSPHPMKAGLMVVADNLFAFSPLPTGPDSLPPVPEGERLVSPFSRTLGDGSLTFAVSDEGLAVYDTKSNKVVRTSTAAFGGRKSCFPIRGGTPVYVGCNTEGEMTLFRIDDGASEPKIVRTFRGIYTQDFGSPPNETPLALAANCAGEQEPGAFCLEKNGTFVDEKLPPAEATKLARMGHMVHVAASPDGEAMSFGWEDGNGPLVVADLARKIVRRFPREKLLPKVTEGIRWDATSIRKGHVRFFLAEGKILDIAPDDTTTLEPLGNAVAVASFHEKALQATTDGRLRETQDGGKTWIEVTRPPGGLGEDLRMICWEGGCELGAFFRVGWTRR